MTNLKQTKIPTAIWGANWQAIDQIQGYRFVMAFLLWLPLQGVVTGAEAVAYVYMPGWLFVVITAAVVVLTLALGYRCYRNAIHSLNAD